MGDRPRRLNSSVTPYSGADGDGDGVVDQDDYGVWRAHFGQTIVVAAFNVTEGSATAPAIVNEPQLHLPVADHLEPARIIDKVIELPVIKPRAERHYRPLARESFPLVHSTRDEVLAAWLSSKLTSWNIKSAPIADGDMACDPGEREISDRPVAEDLAIESLVHDRPALSLFART